jgi:RNA polymerase sigma factor (TIGR02999 family)
MSVVTNILNSINRGEQQAAAELLPLVYDELRQLAAHRLAQEMPGQTLQATALVHEAYLRLVEPGDEERHWNNRRHFFGAAAEAMRRILIEQARRKRSQKHGGGKRQVELEHVDLGYHSPADELLAIDEALTALAREDPQAARLIELNYFAGISVADAAEMVGISRSKAYEHWSYARVRLKCLLA